MKALVVIDVQKAMFAFPDFPPYDGEAVVQRIADLIARGSCGLTPFAASSRHHLAFLQPLATMLGEDRCPVT